jgi:hypothetical protein
MRGGALLVVRLPLPAGEGPEWGVCGHYQPQLTALIFLCGCLIHELGTHAATHTQHNTTHIHSHTHSHTHISTHTHSQPHSPTHTYTHKHSYTLTNTHTHIHIHIYTLLISLLIIIYGFDPFAGLLCRAPIYLLKHSYTATHTAILT